MSAPLTPQQFQQQTNVSRETLQALETYEGLLCKWQKSINLVSKSTLEDIWRRHFLDSAQLAPILRQFAPEDAQCVDMGAGAGFPGLVLAAMGCGQWTLIESDSRKGVFLSEVVRQCGISATIRVERVEGVSDMQADIVTARAFASLDKLLAYATPLMKPGAVCLFPKGRRFAEEVAIARDEGWRFDLREFASNSDDEGKILLLEGVVGA